MGKSKRTRASSVMTLSGRTMKKNRVKQLANPNIDSKNYEAQHHHHHVQIERTKEALRNFKRNFTLGKMLTTILWTCIFTIGIYLTATMSASLLKQYRDEPVLTTMQLIVNRSMSLPIQPILCISMRQFYLQELWYMQLYDEDEEVPRTSEWWTEIDGNWPKFITKAVDTYFTSDNSLSYANSLYATNLVKVAYNISDDSNLAERLKVQLRRLETRSSASATAYQDAVARFFNEHSADIPGAIFSNRWKPSWLFVVFSCLNIAKQCEIASWNRNCDADFWRPDSNNRQHEHDRRNACIELENRLQSWNISTQDMRQQFGIQIMDINEMEIYSVKGSAYEAHSGSATFTNVVAASSQGLCYEVNLEKFMSGFEVQIADYSTYALPKKIPNSQTAIKLSLMLVFNGFERHQFGKENLGMLEHRVYEQQWKIAASAFSEAPLCLVEMQHNRYVVIKLSAVYRYLEEITNGERRYSSHYPSYYNCFHDCNIGAIQRELNCTPTSLNPPMTETGNLAIKWKYPECSIEALTNTSRIEDVTEIVNCTKQCLRPCEEWRISVKQVNEDEWLKGTNFAKIYYQFDLETYTAFKEQYSMNLQNFVGNLGGILGLWLGIDLILMTEIVILPLQFFGSLFQYLAFPLMYAGVQEKTEVGKKSENGDVEKKSRGKNEAFDPCELYKEIGAQNQRLDRIENRTVSMEITIQKMANTIGARYDKPGEM